MTEICVYLKSGAELKSRKNGYFCRDNNERRKDMYWICKISPDTARLLLEIEDIKNKLAESTPPEFLDAELAKYLRKNMDKIKLYEAIQDMKAAGAPTKMRNVFSGVRPKKC